MALIQNERQYEAMLARVDELFFETDEETSPYDPRLVELDMLAALIEEYEKEGTNPLNGETKITTRKRIHVDYELPLGDEYGKLIRSFI